MVSKLPGQKGQLIQLGVPKELYRAEIVSKSDGSIEPSYTLSDPGNYRVNIVPAALWKDPPVTP